MSSDQRRAAVTVGLSGCSSSGKTTLARLLRDIFNNNTTTTTTTTTFILHEDDFYRPEEELPMKDGLLDWDCAESINVADLERALSHIRSEGTFPPFVNSKEDQNSVGQCPASQEKIEAMRQKVAAWSQPGQPGHDIFFSSSLSSSSANSANSANSPPPAAAAATTVPSPLRMCLLDGFLLYSPPQFDKVMSLIDIKLFLQVSRAKATQRRDARDGYVTLEGFWKDPPGYVDKIVWPNYVEAHKWMFVDGEVEGGRLDWDALRERGILAQKGSEKEEATMVDFDFERTLEWVVDAVMSSLEAWHAEVSQKKA